MAYFSKLKNKTVFSFLQLLAVVISVAQFIIDIAPPGR